MEIEIGPRLAAYIEHIAYMTGGVLASAILYVSACYALKTDPSLTGFIAANGPTLAMSIRSMMKRSPKDVWDGKNDRRTNQ